MRTFSSRMSSAEKEMGAKERPQCEEGRGSRPVVQEVGVCLSFPDASLGLVRGLVRQRKGFCIPLRLGWSTAVGKRGRGTSGYMQYRNQKMMNIRQGPRDQINNVKNAPFWKYLIQLFIESYSFPFPSSIFTSGPAFPFPLTFLFPLPFFLAADSEVEAALARMLEDMMAEEIEETKCG